MILRISSDCWLKEYPGLPVIDVRSPGEYHNGHIPEADNITVLTDDEREAVSIAHNLISVDPAVEMGLGHYLTLFPQKLLSCIFSFC